MNFKELEKTLFDLTNLLTSKVAKKTTIEDEFLIYSDFHNQLNNYSKECFKIAETKVYNILTLKSAKDIISSFRVILDALNLSIEYINRFIENGKEIYELINNIKEIKTNFEKIMSCIDNYLFKFNQREYGILQDEDINVICKKIIKLFKIICINMKSKNYDSFVMDIERMNKRYEIMLKNTKTLDLRNADVTSK